MLVCGYGEYARFSVFKHNGQRYVEQMRCLLKRKGATKFFKVTNIKKSPNKRYEFFCTINKDLCRVTLDLAHE